MYYYYFFLAPTIDWFKGETLCLDSFNGSCPSALFCNYLHPTYNGKPFIWQIHLPRTPKWQDLTESVNDLLENAFRTANSDGCRFG